MMTMTTTPRRHTCPGCHGSGQITVLVPETRSGTVYPDGWPAWGGTGVRVEYETGRMVPRCSMCALCAGSGRVRCARCADTGAVETAGTLAACDCEAATRTA